MNKPKKVIVYMPLKPDAAKRQNLPVKLPVLLEDLPKIIDKEKIDLDVIIRGLDAQYSVSKDDYYGSYLVYFCYEKFKKALNTNNLEEAEKWLEKAKKIKEDYRYHFYKGLLLRKKGELGLAEIELRKSVELKEDFYLGYYELGRLMQKKGEYDDAVKFYILSLEKAQGEFSLPLLGIIDTYIVSGMLDSALKIIENTSKNFPLSADLYLRKGVIYNEKQNYALAEQAFSEGLKKEGRWEFHYNRAFSKTRLGDFLGAYNDLKKAYEMTQAVEILYELGLLERNMGLVEDAVEHLEKYYNETKDYKATVALSRSFTLLGDFKQARELIDELPDESIYELKKEIALYEGMVQGLSQVNTEFENPVMRSLAKKYNSGELELLFDKLIDATDMKNQEFVNFGKVDYRHLLNYLSKSNNPELSNRATRLLTGEIPESIEPDLSMVELFFGLLVSLRENIPEAMLLSYRFPFLVSGNGSATALFRILYRVYLWYLGGLNFNSEWFLEEVIDEIKEFHFETALFLSRAQDNRLLDVDSALEIIPTNPKEFLLKLFSLLEKGGLPEAAKIEDGYYKILHILELGS